MGHALRPFHRRGRVTPDWALIAVGLMACALLAGVLIPAGTSAQASRFGTHVGGLRTLSETETLVLFEDYGSGGGSDWSGGQRNAETLGLGAIWLADPASDPLNRTIPLPAGTVRAVLSFDLIAIDDWAGEGLEVSLGDTAILLHRFDPRPGLAPAAAAPHGNDRLAVRTVLGARQDRGLGTGGPHLAEERLAVEIAATMPGATLALRIAPVPAEAGETGRPAPLWAVDNLIVVAERLP